VATSRNDYFSTNFKDSSSKSNYKHSVVNNRISPWTSLSNCEILSMTKLVTTARPEFWQPSYYRFPGIFYRKV
jgi:hypothetical protein